MSDLNSLKLERTGWDLQLTSALALADDKENKFGVESAKDKALLNQYLFFQASGQGPYFGQVKSVTLRRALVPLRLTLDL